MKKEEKVNNTFCPVPNCGGIMEEQIIPDESGQGTRIIWKCSKCGLVYKGARPMEIWSEVAQQSS